MADRLSNPLINAGDIVSVDNGLPVSMKLAQKGDVALAGVISTQPGQLLGDKDSVGMRPVALMGRVPVKVNLEGGPITIGDRIAVSSVPGVGKKAGPFDDSVGIALESTSEDSTIMTFVTLSRGIDINAIAMTLLGNDAALFAAPTTASSTAIASTTTGPIDFVGGMMSAIASRIGILGDASTASTTDTGTSTSPTDPYISDFLHSIFARLMQWFADASNGIENFIAGTVHAHKFCADDICFTRDQLAAILAVASQQSVSAPSPSTTQSATPQAPVIELNGNASSTIELGDTYSDLGARIVAPGSDLNLGLVIVLDGATTTAVSIDTSAPGEHTILYTVTSPTTGLTGSALRTVIIATADEVPEPANDNPFNAAPANDNASSTAALDAAA